MRCDTECAEVSKLTIATAVEIAKAAMEGRKTDSTMDVKNVVIPKPLLT